MMAKDREDKYDEQDDSEYHFSDDEVNYEVGDETPVTASTSGSQRIAAMTSFAKSKRMLISVVVFLGLVFIVYKMVSPTSTVVPTTEIAATSTHSQSNTAATMATQSPVASPPMTAPPVPGAMMQAPTVSPANNSANSPAMSPPSMQPLAVQSPAATLPPSGAALMQQQQQQIQPQQLTQVQSPAPMQQQLPPPINQATAPPVLPQSIPQQPPTGSLTNLPVQPAVSTYDIQSPIVAGTQVDAKAAALAADADRLMIQSQAVSAQKQNEYSGQNKELQDQIQTLSAKVVNLESQLTQLLQVLTRQQAVVNQPVSAPPPTLPPMEQPKVPYNVQAIIPGRAWLKAENGETLTVAEGEMVRGLGRVTKIDPYDGVVEINTGNKAISLSYGNGG